jgi:hypothetical protein
VTGHMFTNYDRALKADGEVGNNKAYDPRTRDTSAEESIVAIRAARTRAIPEDYRHAAISSRQASTWPRSYPRKAFGSGARSASAAASQPAGSMSVVASAYITVCTSSSTLSRR